MPVVNSYYSLESILAQTLLHSLWQIALLALLAAFVLTLLNRRSAALRHALGMLFLLAMTAAPVITFALLMPELSRSGTPVQAMGALQSLNLALQILPEAPASASTLLLPWLWCAGVAFMLVRLLGGWWVFRSLDKQQSLPLPQHWLLRADELRRAMGIRRAVAVRVLQSIGLPCTARVWRPVIWLPVSMLTQLPPDQIEALIAHELAHIHRLDWLWNGLQCVIEAILFYHPGVWWLSRRIRQERENACDDLAVAACGDAIVLAEALATLERLRLPGHLFALSANGGSLMQRVTRLLSPDAHSRLRWGVPIGLLVLVCSGVLLAAQLNPSNTSTSAAATLSWLTARGDTVEIRDDADGKDRVYKKWQDGSGKVHESYSLNGKTAAIDADVRAWLKVLEEQARNISPPPLPPPPPPPPAPPEPPSILDVAAVQAALNVARANPALIEILGSPIVAEAMNDSSYLNDHEAQFSITLSGPKAAATLTAVGERRQGQWQFSQLDIEVGDGDVVIDLASDR